MNSGVSSGFALTGEETPNWGPSPIRAKTYGKEPLQPSIWAN
jgi:hypothetical protein